MDIRPNHTLYVNNLNDKVKKNDLKKALYYIFGQHGRLIDIIAMKTMKMRGQAFIIYQDIACATQAYRSLQGFQLFQRPMRVTYAKKDSQQIICLKGVSAEVQKRREEEREKRRRKKMAQRAAAVAAALQAANQSVNGPKDHQVSNSKVRRRVLGNDGKSVDEVVNLHRLRWLGHVLRLPEHQLQRRSILTSVGDGWNKVRGGQTKT
ncbi:unnamed protein product [Schistosoma mattheei]|uniref:Uncharacterized protein n=1 Tax=Schistosoma mattheei TaxID=31246 RepID=A0A183PI60_9TREM|nr:unnamed protein product [Schistosoma mattheei]